MVVDSLGQLWRPKFFDSGFALHGERYLSLDEMVATVEGLAEDEVGAVAAEFFAPGRQTTVWLGPEDRR